jgi:hypothetical protein
MSRNDFSTEHERREWDAQERALREERAGLKDRRAADGSSAAAGIYRLVARALRQPRLDPLPSDFATVTAARIEAATGAADFVEAWLERGLVLLLMLTGAAVVLSYSVEPLRALWAALPESADVTSPPFGVWALAVAACVGLTWVVERWQKAG